MKLVKSLSDDELSKGFDPEHDIFQRRNFALRLTGLFEQLEQGSVCFLDGRWGVGKSTFVRQWQAELRTKNIPSIYFDAFASDYLESPFEALAGSFISAAQDAKRSGQPGYRKFLNKAASVGRTIAATSAKVGVKAASLGVLSLSDVEGFSKVGDALADGASDITEAGVKRLLESHDERRKQFSELRTSLEGLPELLKPDQSDETRVPLIVFIDELDRCRPDFSLGILEILKHFFRSDGIHFILVTNLDHLKNSVSIRYGSSRGSSEYLEKFYDFIVHFEPEYDKHSEGNISKFIALTLGRLISENVQERSNIAEYIRAIASAHRLSLRQIQALSVNVALAYLAARDREFRPVVLVTFLAFLKTVRSDLYKSAKSGTLNHELFDQFVGNVEWGSFDIGRVSKVFRFYTQGEVNLNDPEWRGFGNDLWNFNLDRERVIPYLCNAILDRFAQPAT